MIERDDTIAAIATGGGRAAVGIVRLSGPRAIEIAEMVAGRRLRDSPRRMTLVRLRDQQGQTIDEALAVAMPGPGSFTGEDVAELHGHGGSETMRLVLAAVLAAGARAAEAGEFSRRAFENGRLDLTQAEGILAVIEAGSERAHRAGQALLSGELRGRIEALRERGNALAAAFEAEIDFPEDVETAGRAEQVQALADDVATLASTGRVGELLREGVSVALVGATNAGKSSLFNRLVGKERALVAPEPGTTRDFVEAVLDWNGLAVTLVDTAGTREAAGVEGRGIELGRERASECDLEIVVVEASAPAPVDLSSRELLVRSKCDLEAPTGSGIATSAVDGSGLDDIRAAVLERLGGPGLLDEGLVLISARQQALLAEAAEVTARASAAANAGRPAELVAADLREFRGVMSRVLGEELSDEMLDSLFAQFCIGK